MVHGHRLDPGSGARNRPALHVARRTTDGELIGAGAVQLGLHSAAAAQLRALFDTLPASRRQPPAWLCLSGSLFRSIYTARRAARCATRCCAPSARGRSTWPTPTSHPEVGALTLAAARSRLQDALQHLPELAKAQEQGAPHRLMAAEPAAGRLELVLDEISDTGLQQRAGLPFHGQATGPQLLAAGPAPSLSTVLGPLTLDRLTVADDPAWLTAIEQQTNLPPSITDGLRRLYPP